VTITENLRQILSEPDTVFLDGASGGEGNDSFLFRNPLRVLEAHSLDEVTHTLTFADEAIQDGLFVAGFITYEAGYAFLPDKLAGLREKDWGAELGYPLIWLGVYPRREAIQAPAPKPQADSSLPSWVETESRESFEGGVERIRDLIHEGDVYQVNHTTRFVAPNLEDPTGLYETLRSRQPVRYASYISAGDITVLSLSPELFFETAASVITARPMKGTASRGSTLAEDERLQNWLQDDEKNRAENLMIVDLLRNDLSLVCEPGSVRTQDLFSIEQLPTVHQMTSTVSGRLHDDVRLSHIMKALFPCGSITGAPKIRAMRRIAELESSARGVYCGAIGYAGPGLEAAFSVAIRTAVLSGNEITYGVGGGVVWDSDPQEEYREAMLKRDFISDQVNQAEHGADLKLIETMYSDGDVPLVDYHLDRLENSSSDLGFKFNRSEVRRTITNYCSEYDDGEGRRIRLLLDREGQIQIESRPVDMLEDTPLRVGLSTVRVSSGHPQFRHKTTQRGVYEKARAIARAENWYDALLINERGEVTEGTITNLFVEMEGGWVTPPLESGLLSGVGRRVFMLANAVREQVVFPADLIRARRIILTNAVIGAREAVFSGGVRRI